MPIWDPVIAALTAGRRFVLTTHVSSDGDGIGCELALARVLRRQGKTVAIVNPTATQSRYEFLHRPGEIETYDGRHDGVLNAADLIVVLDINRWDRLGAMSEPVRRSPAQKLCIDHHPSPEYFGPADVSDAAACATGILIYDLVQALGMTITSDLVEPLHVAIMTDTGSFRFSNTNYRALEVAADLVKHGARPDELYRAVYETSSPGRMRLLGLVLGDLEYAVGGRLVHFTITNAMLEECGVGRDEAEGFTDIVRWVDGSLVVISFVELDDGGAKISLRSKRTNLDVGKIAHELGGGGHATASGIVDPRPLLTVRQDLLARVERLLASRDE